MKFNLMTADMRTQTKVPGEGEISSTTASLSPDIGASYTSKSKKMLLCTLPGTDNFVDEIIKYLKPEVEVRKVVSNRLEAFLKAFNEQDTIWLEWGNQLAEIITRQIPQLLKGRRIILRIHAYETMTGLADRIDYSHINDLIFVAPHIRDIQLGRMPQIKEKVKRIHVIPNGVDEKRLIMPPKKPGFNIAYGGYINFKKDPMLLLHAFEALHNLEPRFTLHIAGTFQDNYYVAGFKNFIANHKLESVIRSHGWVKDLQDFYQDKHYVICSSLSEGHPVGLLEGMAMGCQPLIYNWPGADAFYPKEFIWNNLRDLARIVNTYQSPDHVRAFVVGNYSLAKQINALKRMLCNCEQVEFKRFDIPW